MHSLGALVTFQLSEFLRGRKVGFHSANIHQAIACVGHCWPHTAHPLGGRQTWTPKPEAGAASVGEHVAVPGSWGQDLALGWSWWLIYVPGSPLYSPPHCLRLALPCPASPLEARQRKVWPCRTTPVGQVTRHTLGPAFYVVILWGISFKLYCIQIRIRKACVL